MQRFVYNVFICPSSQAVSKISAMFPTVEEAHIRDLYKKCVSSLTHCIVLVTLTPLTQVSRLPGSCHVSSPGRQTPDSGGGPRHVLRVLAHGLAARHSSGRGSGRPRWDHHDWVTAAQPSSSVHDTHHGGKRHQLPGRVLWLPHAEAWHRSLGPRHSLHGQSSDRGK